MRLIHPRISKELYLDARNIRRQLQRLALQETADFVCSEMRGARYFDYRLALLEFAVDQARQDGLFLEFGVFTGTTIRLIARRAKTKVHGFDSFEGLPEDWRPEAPRGTFKVDQVPEVPENVVLVKGVFAETIPPFLTENPGTVSFIHIDCDLYSSTSTVFHHLQDRIEPGTVIVFDEFFNYWGWRDGEFKAFVELARRIRMTYEYIGYSDRQVAIKVLHVGRSAEFRSKKGQSKKHPRGGTKTK